MIARALEAEILRLHHSEHWPIGTIAAQLKVHHGTVRRVLAQAGEPVAQATQRPSMVDPYRAFIVETLTKYPTLRASRLYTMVRERGYPGAPDHFRALVAQLRPRPAAEAYLRLRTLPGEQAQADWAHFSKFTVGRAERPLMAFVMVLSYSRQLFLRFYLGAAMNYFIRGHVEAFAAFSAVPRVVLYDFVAGNKIGVMCPPPLCDRRRVMPRLVLGGSRACGNIIGYRAFNQSRSVLSSFQAALPRLPAEVAQAGSHARRAAAFARSVNSAYRLVVSRLT